MVNANTCQSCNLGNWRKSAVIRGILNLIKLVLALPFCVAMMILYELSTFVQASAIILACLSMIILILQCMLSGRRAGSDPYHDAYAEAYEPPEDVDATVVMEGDDDFHESAQRERWLRSHITTNLKN